MDELRGWLLLREVKGLGERSIKKLWEVFGSSRNILEASLGDLEKVVGRKRAEILSERKGVNERRVERTLKLLVEEGVKALSLSDSAYPEGIRSIPDPPPVIFYRGCIKKVDLLGVVGSRKVTAYTLNWMDNFVREVVKHGLGVVSGGAPGTDSKAHLSAIENSGYTVCVLGFGILKARGSLFKRIEESGGLLISEFDPLEEGGKFTFPRRNRLIASLSKMLIIPQAGERSGALITADFANKYGKKVYVHIGIGSSSSWDGCYELVREGKAELLKGPQELFRECKGRYEDELTEFLKTPRLFDEVVSFLKTSEDEALSKLTELEMEGKVRKTGSYYVAC